MMNTTLSKELQLINYYHTDPTPSQAFVKVINQDVVID